MKQITISPPGDVFPWILSAGFGAVLPLVLVLLVPAATHTEVIEEAAKALSLLLLSFWADRRQMPFLGIVLGLLFGMSESFLYLGSYIAAQGLGSFLARIALTVPMHALTAGIVGWSVSTKRGWIVLGFIAAVLLHLAFNFYVPYLVK